MGQALRANLSLTCAPTETFHYLGPSGAMDARRQVAVGIEIRQRYIILCSGGGPICERDGLGPSPAEMQRTKAKIWKAEIRGQRPDITNQTLKC